jgi:hypothetical protein
MRSSFQLEGAAITPGNRSARLNTRETRVNFLKAHLSLIELLDQIRRKGISVRVRDDSRYATHRNANRLLRSLRDWDAVVANVVGQIGDALDENAGAVVAPIKDRPDFEHLEAKGVDVLRKLAARQRKRKKH